MNVLKALPERPVFRDYVARTTDRPAFRLTAERDAAMAAEIPTLQKIMAGRA